MDLANLPVNVFEYEALARQRLDKMAYDYYASGAGDERTVDENSSAYDEILVRYRVMRDVSSRALSTSVLGCPTSMPILVAPTAFHGMACEEGELATVRAAGEIGTIFILSTLSNTAMEEVVDASSGPVWFQLYVYEDRQLTRELVQRADDAGCEVLVLTVDSPILGRRERDVRNRFHLPDGLQVKNAASAGYGALDAPAGDSGLAAYVSQLMDASLNWKDLDWLCSVSRLPVLVKGVVRADDAVAAMDHGAAGVVVSNHGGRQLDTSMPTIRALPEIAAAVGERGEILIDGGVRRGTDVLKALALGAKAVLVGRPVLWGLSANGQQGAEHVLTLLRDELDLAMALSGSPTLDHLTPDLVEVPAAWGH